MDEDDSDYVAPQFLNHTTFGIMEDDNSSSSSAISSPDNDPMTISPEFFEMGMSEVAIFENLMRQTDELAKKVDSVLKKKKSPKRSVSDYLDHVSRGGKTKCQRKETNRIAAAKHREKRKNKLGEMERILKIVKGHFEEMKVYRDIVDDINNVLEQKN